MAGFPPISVRQPRAHDIVDDPVEACGVGTGFEATFAARVRDGNGVELAQATITAGGTGIWATSTSSCRLAALRRRRPEELSKCSSFRQMTDRRSTRSSCRSSSVAPSSILITALRSTRSRPARRFRPSPSNSTAKQYVTDAATRTRPSRIARRRGRAHRPGRPAAGSRRGTRAGPPAARHACRARHQGRHRHPHRHHGRRGRPPRGHGRAAGPSTPTSCWWASGSSPKPRWPTPPGWTTDNGTLVDESQRTSHPNVYAAGDSARTRLADGTLLRRAEHWEHAMFAGETAAAALLGQDLPVARSLLVLVRPPRRARRRRRLHGRRGHHDHPRGRRASRPSRCAWTRRATWSAAPRSTGAWPSAPPAASSTAGSWWTRTSWPTRPST